MVTIHGHRRPAKRPEVLTGYWVPKTRLCEGAQTSCLNAGETQRVCFTVNCSMFYGYNQVGCFMVETMCVECLVCSSNRFLTVSSTVCSVSRT